LLRRDRYETCPLSPQGFLQRVNCGLVKCANLDSHYPVVLGGPRKMDESFCFLGMFKCCLLVKFKKASGMLVIYTYDARPTLRPTSMSFHPGISSISQMPHKRKK
jgi:hypothetical protein